VAPDDNVYFGRLHINDFGSLIPAVPQDGAADSADDDFLNRACEDMIAEVGSVGLSRPAIVLYRRDGNVISLSKARSQTAGSGKKVRNDGSRRRSCPLAATTLLTMLSRALHVSGTALRYPLSPSRTPNTTSCA
jgi:hypothetical protein